MSASTLSKRAVDSEEHEFVPRTGCPAGGVVHTLEGPDSLAEQESTVPSYVLPAIQAPVVGEINLNNLVVFVNAIVLQDLHVFPTVA